MQKDVKTKIFLTFFNKKRDNPFEVIPFEYYV